MRLVVIVVTSLLGAVESVCSREPADASQPRQPPDGRFSLAVVGQPASYVPGQQYTVTLRAEGDRKFSAFTLAAEPRGGQAAHKSAGNFSLFGDTLTAFSERCPSAVQQASLLPKSDISVLWKAPTTGAGCVVFRATVVDTESLWYMDDGPLSLQLCEHQAESDKGTPPIVDPCCACEEAKYEMAFEGLWSRHTHPRDFPKDHFKAKFSDVIGASHMVDYRFWNYGEFASEGLKELAEEGSTRTLESELKEKSQHIRTIIKARGISYPNVTGKTFAVFRVDSKHHLVSMVSKIAPSPDWIVGVSGLELCLPNCSWIEKQKVDLYPWDIGTDNGVTYESGDAPSIPAEPVSKITSSQPGEPTSPFYDPAGEELKPLASLYLTRQRLYEKKNCAEPLPQSTDEDCLVTAWSQWTSCSVTCGKGERLRQRFYVDPEKADALKCRVPLTSRSVCYGSLFTCRDRPRLAASDPRCAVTDWSEWSSCSASCGQGHRTRTRHYQHPHARKWCMHQHGAPVIQQTDICEEPVPACPGHQGGSRPQCQRLTEWSMWTPCSVTCGRGTKMRHRYPDTDAEMTGGSGDQAADDDEDGATQDCDSKMVEVVECDGQWLACQPPSEEEAREICLMQKEKGPCNNLELRWFYNKETESCQQFEYGGCRGNRNKFNSREACEQMCAGVTEELRVNRTARLLKYGVSLSGVLNYKIYHPGPTMDPACVGEQTDGVTAEPSKETSRPVDCITSSWSGWSACSATCGHGYKQRTRTIEVPASKGGKACPKKLIKRRKCKMSACVKQHRHREHDGRQPRHGPNEGPAQPEDSVDDDSQTDGEDGEDQNVSAAVEDDDSPYSSDEAKKIVARSPGRSEGVVLSSPQRNSFPAMANMGEIDCELSEWTAWSSCSMTCGSNAYMQRTRSILTQPSEGGLPCSKRIEVKPCDLRPCRP